MITTAIGNLLDRAERIGAALVICDEKNHIIKINHTHAQIYNFIDFNINLKFDQFLWRCIETSKLANPIVYQDPHKWVEMSNQYRKMSNYSQFVTNHSNGNVFLVCHEKVNNTNSWWYQIRIDITQEIKRKFSKDNELLGPASWDGTFAPLTRNTTVPIVNVLDAMPAAAGLIVARGKLLDANLALSNLLRERDGLQIIGDRVIIQNNSEQAEFLRRLERFFEPGGQQKPINMRISRQESEEAYFLNVSPLLNRGRETWDNGHIGVLTVADPSLTLTIDPGTLVSFFGITLAEAEVAAALGAGYTVAAIAEKRCVQVNTIHAQIKKIVEKTGYKGQGDIARRVSDLARIFGNRC